MTVTFDMPKDIEAKFMAEAHARGVPLSDYVLDFIVEHYQEDADDLLVAQERLSDPQPRTHLRPVAQKPWSGRLNTTHGLKKT